MSYENLDEISSTIDQIKLRLPNIEGSISCIKSEIPTNLNFRLFNIQSSLSDIEEKVNYKSILSKSKNPVSSDQPDKNNAQPISISEDHRVQIEKHKRYLKKHLNNAIQKHLSELDIKMKKIESDFKPYLNPPSDVSASSVDPFDDLKSEIMESFSEFNSKYQDLYTKISNVQVQKKISYEKASNQLARSIDAQIKRQQSNIRILKTKIDETQQIMNNHNKVKTTKAAKTQKPVQDTPVLPDIKKINQDQKDQVNLLKSKWLDVRESISKQLMSVDNKINGLVKSNEKVIKTMNNYEQKLSNIQSNSEKISENFDSIQNKIDEELNKLDQSSLKCDIDKLKLSSTLELENDKNQIDEIGNYVNQLYDRITELYLD